METQTAYARSAYSDPQNIASAITTLVACLALPEVVAIIPLQYMPLIAALSGVLSIVLRVAFGVRPVANIAPKEVKAVEVQKLALTQQGSETP